jgi:hypothetical protein
VPHFYDAQEAGRVSPEDYYLEIEAGRIDVHVDGELQHVADVTQQRITFAADGELWALKFASEEGYQKFYTKLMVSQHEKGKGMHALCVQSHNRCQQGCVIMIAASSAMQPASRIAYKQNVEPVAHTSGRHTYNCRSKRDRCCE